MNAQSLQEALAQVPIVSRFYFYERIDSTMEQARRLLNGSSSRGLHGTLFVADYQDSGKGRHGRQWLAAPGQSVLVSVLLSMELLPDCGHPDQLSLLACAVPVAFCKALQGFAPEVAIKYPNDLVADGRKIGGILMETHGNALIIGIGINCSQNVMDLPSDVRMPASSLFLETGRLIAREEVIAELMRELGIALQEGALEPAITTMNEMCETLGKDICIDIGGEVLSGIATRVCLDGTLELRTAEETMKIHSSQITRTWSATHPRHD